jgi:hypothetical protein
VDLIGIEPMTSSMPWKRAPSCATGPRVTGGNNFSIFAALAHFVKQVASGNVTAFRHEPISNFPEFASGFLHIAPHLRFLPFTGNIS